jgi:hypothetical protein
MILDSQEQMPEPQVPEMQLESQIVPETQLEDHSLETLSSHRTTLTPRVTSTPQRQSKGKPKVPPKPKAKASASSAHKRQGSLSNANSTAKRKATERWLLADKDANIVVENFSTENGPDAQK